VDPNQKERVILALKKAGHVVGFLGDGINDASALHAADVGISVEGAVEVAKEAVDFVLLEPDLDVLRRGIERSRACSRSQPCTRLRRSSRSDGSACPEAVLDP
jgi:Mg2+-importing ATPase